MENGPFEPARGQVATALAQRASVVRKYNYLPLNYNPPPPQPQNA